MILVLKLIDHLPADRTELVNLEDHVLHPVVAVHHRVQLEKENIQSAWQTNMSKSITLKRTPCWSHQSRTLLREVRWAVPPPAPHLPILSFTWLSGWLLLHLLCQCHFQPQLQRSHRRRQGCRDSIQTRASIAQSPSYKALKMTGFEVQGSQIYTYCNNVPRKPSKRPLRCLLDFEFLLWGVGFLWNHLASIGDDGYTFNVELLLAEPHHLAKIATSPGTYF